MGEGVPGERKALHGEGKDDHGEENIGSSLPATACLSRKVLGVRSSGEPVINYSICRVAVE